MHVYIIHHASVTRQLNNPLSMM